ncbi:MAG: hypothetical protein HY870_07600 [Chloroflexi bacterium]|nr:hypothetical protein [Chloroflexota bacterium]
MESLEILSTGWVQAHVDRANSILSKPQYTAADWQEFFTEYFGAHPFTDELRDYLVYPVFWWFDEAVHVNLQIGLIVPLQARIDTSMAAHSDELGGALDADADLRETLFNSHRLFNTYFHDGVIDLAARQGLDSFYLAHINAYPLWLKNSVRLDIATQPYVAALRAQIAMNVGDALPLTEARKVAISGTLDLTGAYAALWLADTLLVLDNNGLDQPQLDLIHRFLQNLPGGIHDLRYITVDDLLGNVGGRYQQLANQNGVNISGVPIGGYAENGFPDDVPPFLTDGFAIVVAHEVNHRVDALFTSSQPDLAERREKLIAHAGFNCHNYLRSMFDNGYFVNTPQEFYASIANQWFANTQRTLDLALTRWKAGYHDPINQFLFFAEVYSQGGSFVPFYRLDVQGQLARADVQIERDSHGHITAIRANKPYRFTLDGAGAVVDVLSYETFLPVLAR